MDAYVLGKIFGVVLGVVLFAWLIIGAIVEVVRYFVIRKRHGEEAAREFLNSRKRRAKK
ncbi:hypothetical protein [Rathayibacter rathayi]|uniref:hypothetical protein n=1 Tax=Rathayibacter rathayi TaxID=33887 RepID=UPI0015E2F595|nr:hypothetical protein [Rathayibacter rathayi]